MNEVILLVGLGVVVIAVMAWFIMVWIEFK
jgi:hypothetical protein